MTEPKYKHDCDKCTFVPWPFTPFDTYVCPQRGHPTMILRYGNEGSDYESVPLAIICSKLFTTWRENAEKEG